MRKWITTAMADSRAIQCSQLYCTQEASFWENFATMLGLVCLNIHTLLIKLSAQNASSVRLLVYNKLCCYFNVDSPFSLCFILLLAYNKLCCQFNADSLFSLSSSFYFCVRHQVVLLPSFPSQAEMPRDSAGQNFQSDQPNEAISKIHQTHNLCICCGRKHLVCQKPETQLRNEIKKCKWFYDHLYKNLSTFTNKKQHKSPFSCILHDAVPLAWT